MSERSQFLCACSWIAQDTSTSVCTGATPDDQALCQTTCNQRKLPQCPCSCQPRCTTVVPCVCARSVHSSWKRVHDNGTFWCRSGHLVLLPPPIREPYTAVG